MSGPSERDEIAADREALFRAVLNSLPICCEECREDPDGAVWHDATGATEAILASDWLAERDRRTAAAAVSEFAHWVAVARAYNGSDHERGQSLYNECLNAVLPTWALEWADEQQGRDQ